MARMIAFVVPGPPVGFGNQLGRFKFTKKKVRYIEYMKKVQAIAAALVELPLKASHAGEAIRVTTHSFFVNGVHPDPENVHKGIKDALFYAPKGTAKGCGDKYTGGSYSWPLYDAHEPRVEVIVELP